MSINEQFDRGAILETATLDADYTGTWIAMPADAAYLVAHCVISNTDTVGVLKFQGANDRDNPVLLPFEEIDGTIDSDGYDVDDGVDLNEIFVIPHRAAFVRPWFDYTSGTADEIKVTINTVRYSR